MKKFEVWERRSSPCLTEEKGKGLLCFKTEKGGGVEIVLKGSVVLGGREEKGGEGKKRSRCRDYIAKEEKKKKS